MEINSNVRISENSIYATDSENDHNILLSFTSDGPTGDDEDRLLNLMIDIVVEGEILSSSVHHLPIGFTDSFESLIELESSFPKRTLNKCFLKKSFNYPINFFLLQTFFTNISFFDFKKFPLT
jgi:hypothetical protein